MAIAKIWHYSGHIGEEENPRTWQPREPYLDRQQVTTSATAASSSASPAGTHLARIEVVNDTHYRVNLDGETLVDADTSDPRLLKRGVGVNLINLPPGATISLIEVW